MLTVNIGPLALSTAHVLLMISLLLATVTGWYVGRRSAVNPEKQLFRLLLVALLVARLAFVAVYLEHYRAQPWQALDIRDGGFIAWPGVLAALLLGAWQAWRTPAIRTSLASALAVGVFSWGLGSLTLYGLEQGTRLPALSFRDSNGASVALHDYVGKPLVVNLWATWCPPCRREMPVLAEAQRNHPELTILFVNQGEGQGEVNQYLAAEALGLDNVLLDSGGRLGQHVGSMALPSTLFYDAEGRQIGSHLGELSRASLARALEVLKKDQ
ncbi:MAG: TlpA family protein disulfide reductase [Gammaproteobacteria bacterium]|nr:TlpA family protein disulfide reductase [Gammaproteobacteria bacterium]MBU0884865.1 TlpA family protein disulfide reductase [Gammaproteobacteria bacterium]MBU1858467.1 TlpA family protein disulfide reductase [Gammaproteobacteria bacterium]